MMIINSYKSKFYNGEDIVNDEADEKGFFPFVIECIKDVLKQNSEIEGDLENTFTYFLVKSNNVVYPYQGSFMHQLKKKSYKGLFSSKAFRVTPYNALASYLSVYFHTKAPALSFSVAVDNDTIYKQYVDLIMNKKKARGVILLDLDIHYEGNLSAEQLVESFVDTRRYFIKLNIRYYTNCMNR